jgi:hypothetical protein
MWRWSIASTELTFRAPPTDLVACAGLDVYRLHTRLLLLEWYVDCCGAHQVGRAIWVGTWHHRSACVGEYGVEHRASREVDGLVRGFVALCGAASGRSPIGRT